MHARDADEFASLAFSGLELMPPGLVLVSEWRPESKAPRPTPAEVSCYGGVARKPKTNVYTLLLIIALVALLVGCIFLFLEIKRFGGFGTVPGGLSAISAPAGTLLAQQPLALAHLG